jgi:hypothetical protein
MMERTDVNGDWESDDGITWLLVTPSAAFYAQLAADPEPEVQLSPEVHAAQTISDEITVRLDPAGTITEIKAAITEGLAAAIVSLGG